MAANTFGSPLQSLNVPVINQSLLAVLMVTFCGRHWMKEYAGLGKGRSTFVVSLGIVAVYYGTLLRFFWAMIPNA